ncbi:MAG: orotidine-5'-phosphate decarboxylase [Candidatus Omnitrophica bacterium]|nr:orotidine-5'-phosphate decarboxylase [Candidatus Omnitrophota bacterium]
MRPQLIIALDVDSLAQAQKIVAELGNAIEIFKVGSQLFTAAGSESIKNLQAQHKKVFLDLKFHDIPNTVASAVKAVVHLQVFMYTLHTVGGKEMMKAAAEAATQASRDLGVPRPLGVGVTVLTSEARKENLRDLVLERASLAKEAGLDGVVASVEEAGFIRREFGKDFVIVTPGIRPAGTEVGDQKRVATPAEAVRQGSNFLVVGRPVLQASNPQEAVEKILAEFG